MDPRKTVFVDIDTQYDFMAPEGALYVKSAEQLLPRLRKLIRFAQEKGIPILASADAHLDNDAEFEQFPPHCLAGTRGQKKVEATVVPGARTVAFAPGQLDEYPEGAPSVILEKRAFDVFTNPNAEKVVESLGDRDFVVFGVATDICVRDAALGLLARGKRVSLVTDAIAGVDEAASEKTLKEIAARGGGFYRTDELIAELEGA